MSAKAFAKSPQPARRASGPWQNFLPHDAPKISPTSAAPGKPLALRLPATCQATAPISPSRHKSEKRGPAPQPGPAALMSSAPAWHRECNTVAFAQHRFAVTVRPGDREPGQPPCHRVPAVRHEGPDAASRNRPDASQHVQTARPMKQTGHCAKDGRASPVERQTRAPRTRARQARPAAFPVPGRTLRSHRKSVAGFVGHIISLRSITGKSSVSRPDTHRTTADMPAIAAKPILFHPKTTRLESERMDSSPGDCYAQRRVKRPESSRELAPTCPHLPRLASTSGKS